MQNLINDNLYLRTFWEHFLNFSKIAHPAAGIFKNTAKQKRKDKKHIPLVQSPESVRLRGPFNNDPQRKNPAP